MKKEIHWLEYCKICKIKHRMTQKTCPSCGVYSTPQPVSDKLKCASSIYYECDGCIAYRDRYL